MPQGDEAAAPWFHLGAIPEHKHKQFSSRRPGPAGVLLSGEALPGNPSYPPQGTFPPPMDRPTLAWSRDSPQLVCFYRSPGAARRIDQHTFAKTLLLVDPWIAPLHTSDEGRV